MKNIVMVRRKKISLVIASMLMFCLGVVAQSLIGRSAYKGDANGDNVVNAADIVEVVNYMMGTQSDKFDFTFADANGDGTVNIADILTIVSTIMSGESEDTQTVPKTGGSVRHGDLTIAFPSGTFSSDTETMLSEAEKGSIDGDAELSPYYKVTLTAGVRKAFKVAVKMAKLSDDELVRMQFAVKGWAPSLGIEVLTHCYMDVTYVDGAYVAEIPEMESPDDVKAIEVWFGITKCNPVEGAAARALAGSTGRNDVKLYNKAGTNKAKEILSSVEACISTSVSKLEELGYQKPEDCVINCYLHKDAGIWKYIAGSVDGWCSFSMWGKKYATVNLNCSKLDNPISNENKATIIHELFHFYQQFYDSRSALRYTYESKSTPLILEEASSTWSERFFPANDASEPKLPMNVRDNLFLFIPSINPDHKDVVAPPTIPGVSWGERYQNVGYGAAALIEYLTQKCGDKILLEMWKERQTGDPFDTKGFIERQAKKNGIDIFSQKGYHDFVETLGSRNVYEGISFADMVKERVVHDSIGVLLREVKNGFPNYHTNYVYGYGALVEELYVPLRKEKGKRTAWADNAVGIIEQTTEGVTTWIYRSEGAKMIPCGNIKKGTPLKIEPGWIPNNVTWPGVDFYMVTIADDFKTTKEPVSRIVSSVFLLDVSEKKVAVPSSPGTKAIPLRTNCYNLKFKTDADWLSCFWSVSDSTLRIRHEVMPSNVDSRTAVIQVIAPSESKKEIVMEEIEVTQNNAYIDLSTTDIEVGVKGGANVINITSTNCVDLKVSTKSNFLHPTISGNTISVLVDENTSPEEREGTVIVSGLLKSVNVRGERYIHFTQAGIELPQMSLYNDGNLYINGLGIRIPGKTLEYGDYLLYRSADTQVRTNGSYREELSWTVELYIDPKDNKSMRQYKFYSGSVSWLRNEYWTETDDEGHQTDHQYTTRCSCNLKNLTTDDGLSFYSRKRDEDNDKYTKSEYVSDYSYEETKDGKPVKTVMQADIANEKASSYSAQISLYLADGVPYLEANRDSVIHEGAEYFEIIGYSKNDVVQSVEVTTSDDWMTIDNISSSDYGGSFYLNITVNNTKAPREGQVYVTGTLADGSKLTRSIIVKQSYEAIWDDDRDETEEQKAELPSQDILNMLESHGMPLYLGSSPPRVNGVYRMEPLKTIYDTNGGGDDEYSVNSLVFNITTNSSSASKAMMSYYSQLANGKSTPAEDFYCYVGGDGKNFTLSNVTKYDYGFFSYTLITIVSGTLDGNKITGLHFASVELDEDGNIEGVGIGTDDDGISPTTTWEPGSDDEDYWSSRRRTAIQSRKKQRR